MNYNKLKNRIKKNEGFSTKPYKDQLGNLTIGWGHLILSNEKFLLKKNITKTTLNSIFANDFKKTLKDFNNNLGRFNKNKKNSELLIEMIFQMGIKKVLSFKNLLKNMNKAKKHLVCFEMMNSLWYKQTPNRVKQLIITFLKND